MQLPRGTFREIKKGETIATLLEELERTKFSGVSSTSSPAGTGTLVFKSGKCILVKYLGKAGDPGFEDLIRDAGTEVDAALSTLDDAQIQLALEFNKPCRIIKAPRMDADQRRPAAAAPPVREQVRKPAPPVHAPPVKTTPKPPAASSLFQRQPAAAHEASPAQEPPKPVAGFGRPAMPAPPSVSMKKEAAVPAGGPSESDTETHDAHGQSSIFEKDIDTFDSMDLDNVTDKIRNDCKTMIKQLHLEHLMER